MFGSTGRDGCASSLMRWASDHRRVHHPKGRVDGWAGRDVIFSRNIRFMSDMNMRPKVKMAQPKRATKELETALREAGIRDVRSIPDAVLVQAGRAHVIEVKAVSAGHGRPQEVRNALAHVERQHSDAVVAVVAEHFTTGALDLLREHNVNYLDDSHFVFQVDDPFIAVNRERVARSDKAPARSRQGLAGRIGTAVQEILLEDRDCWRVTDLAAAAGVAIGTAQTALQRLQDLELMEAEGSGPRKQRRILDRGALLDKWAEDAGRERRRLLSTYVYAQGPKNLGASVSERLAGQGIEHAVTGAVAGLIIAPYATDARICEVWVGPNVGGEMLTAALGTEAVDKGGNVVFLQARTEAPLFRAQKMENVSVANAARVYADLLQDPKRGQEQAQFLRQVVLGL
ncbi:MAG: type IV toxin-antitoxin system AbiEi family antitoxin [Coriobacteriia bacterium]|nr:type IV toxin-antitoxin system AbiEi family antitoxin [Coriobacteriia bacterium]